MMKVRTRMAPSPTGEYHIGHIRTALYNWAYARKNNGRFVIRIEDTDRARYVEGAATRILDVIGDYGLDWDEGPRKGGEFGPYVQSERLEMYLKYAKELVSKKKAYYCFCSEETLAAMREEQRKKGVVSPKYDGRCLKLSEDEISKKLAKGEPFVIRLCVPEGKKVVFKDRVYGEIEVDSSEVDDQVLIKSDGFPTYHMAVVVDDHLMGISHVMRGNDWLPSTPKHVLLYEALGWKEPAYIHLPNLKELGASRKLSKRFGPVTAREFLDRGYLPEALLNFVMFLGWNPGSEKEFYTLDEFVNDFSVERIHKSDLVAFDRNKLNWMNREYIQKMEDGLLADKIDKFYQGKYDKKIIIETLGLVRGRISTLQEYGELAGFLFEDVVVDRKSFGKKFKEHLSGAREALKGLEEWKLEQINDALGGMIEERGFKTGEFFMDLRIAITGKRVTPPINESMVILGMKKAVERIDKTLKL